jgi:hypothetical protein
MKARRQRGEGRGMEGGLRVPPALLGAFRLRIHTHPTISRPLLRRRRHIAEGLYRGVLGAGGIYCGRRAVGSYWLLLDLSRRPLGHLGTDSSFIWPVAASKGSGSSTQLTHTSRAP